MSIDPCNLLEPVSAVAREAGRRILEVYNTDFAVSHKDDLSPLTAADMAAHDVIEAGLMALTPRVTVLSEESADIPYAERAAWHSYWLVDPLDGTREFVKRNGEFTVNIALIEDGRPVLGVILAPVTGQMYYACAGGGAYRVSPDGSRARIEVARRCHHPVRVAGSRSHREDSLNGFLQKLGEHEIIGMGSSLKSCLVAEGAVDVYARLGPTSEWDTAAAQCIVEEAGGHLVDTQLRPLRYNTKESLLNPHFLVYGDSSRDWLALL